MNRHQSNVPVPTRDRHVTRVRTTHEPQGYDAPLVSAKPAQEQEAQRDQLYGTQNLMEAAVTLDKLRLQDEFATTILSPGGFLGSWEGFANTGLYNGSFSDNRDNADVPVGRTEYVPYWTITKDVGTPVVQSVQGGVAILFTVASDKVTMISDKVRVRQGVPIQVFINDYNSFSGSLDRVVKVEEYGEGQTTPNVTKTVHTVTAGLGTFSSDRGKVKFGDAIIPRGGANISTPTTHIKIRIEITCNTTSATYFVTEVGYIPVTRMSGTTFPTDSLEEQVSDGLQFYRTDLGEEYYFDEANDRWMSTQLYVSDVAVQRHTNQSIPIAASTGFAHVSSLHLHGAEDIWIVRSTMAFEISAGGSALSGSHKWDVDVAGLRLNTNTGDIFASHTVNSGSTAVWRTSTVAVGALLDAGTAHVALAASVTKTGTPGDLWFAIQVAYRLTIDG